MSAIELLYDALPARAPPEAPTEGLCCVLGTRESTIARKHAIKPSFTNLDQLCAPDSDRVSVRAWRVLTHSEPAAEGRKRDTYPLMQSSWICEAGLVVPEVFWRWEKLTRLEVRELVVTDNLLSEPWCGYVTTSYKKHGCLRAPVNRNGTQRWLFELDVVDCTDRERVVETWRRLLTARTAGIPRPVIETLGANVSLMRKHAALWREFEPWARRCYLSPLYRFLTYLLPGQEELKGAGSAV